MSEPVKCAKCGKDALCVQRLSDLWAVECDDADNCKSVGLYAEDRETVIHAWNTLNAPTVDNYEHLRNAFAAGVYAAETGGAYDDSGSVAGAFDSWYGQQIEGRDK